MSDPTTTPQDQPQSKRNWFARHKILTGILAVFLLFGFAGALGDDETDATQTTASSAAEEDAAAQEPAAEEEPTEEPVEEEAPEPEPVVEEEPEPEPEPDPEPAMTIAQENAVRKALDYLDYSAFSKKGLIEQMQYEGFSPKDATFAANNIDVNWNAQAAAKAEEYMEYSAFSRSGLIEQLMFEGFTRAQAEHGANKVGL